MFEQLGGIYMGIDGILYPEIDVGDMDIDETVFKGRYGGVWMEYMKEKHLSRYSILVRTGKLRSCAAHVNEEAHEMIEKMVQAEEIALCDAVYCYH